MRENEPIKLSRRLTETAFAVREGCRATDVGCDHGKLAAWLILTGRCEYVNAVDISEPSLKKAADLFSRLKIQHKTRAVLADGLSGINPEETDDVIIAGLGFDVIKKILSGADWLKDSKKRLVLAPSSKHPQTRCFLYEEGYRILVEQAVFEAGHIYTIITAEYCGIQKAITPEFASIGKITGSREEKNEYIRAVRVKNEKLLTNIKDTSITRMIQRRLDAERVLAYLDEVQGKSESQTL